MDLDDRIVALTTALQSRPRRESEWDKFILPAIFGTIGFFLVQNLNRSDEASFSVPVILQRLDTIERSVADINTKLLSTREDLFTGHDGDILEDKLEYKIEEEVAKDRKLIEDIDLRLRDIERRAPIN